MTRRGAKPRDWSIQKLELAFLLPCVAATHLPCIAVWNWLVIASNRSMYPSNLIRGSVAFVVCCSVAVENISRSRRIEKCNVGVLRCVAVYCSMSKCNAMFISSLFISSYRHVRNIYTHVHFYIYIYIYICLHYVYIHIRLHTHICSCVHIHLLCWGVFQCVLQHVAVGCNIPAPPTAVCCSMLQRVAVSRSALQSNCSSNCSVFSASQCMQRNAVCSNAPVPRTVSAPAPRDWHALLGICLCRTHDPFIYRTWLIQVRDMSSVQHVNETGLIRASFIHSCSMTHSRTWLICDSFTCATCRARNMSMRHDSFVTHSNVRLVEHASC